MKLNLNGIYGNKILLLLLLFTFISLKAQIATNVPIISPSSPDVSKIIQFNDVPVDNSTGVPDINIPLFNTNTINKDINIDLSLKYNIHDIKINDTPSVVGLGWSLFSGGTISRIVKGLPDEINFPDRRGIYSLNNPFFQYFTPSNDDFMIAIPSQSDHYQSFLWDKIFKNYYDWEYDVYAYSFLGNTGEFIIIKENNSLICKSLNPESNVKFGVVHDNDFKISSIFIYNDLGIKFTFSDIEYTKTYSNTYKQSRNSEDDGISLNTISDLNASAYNLSKVTDSNNIDVLTYEYNDVNEYYKSQNTTIYDATKYGNNLGSSLELYISMNSSIEDIRWNLSNVQPYIANSVSYNYINTKKIRKINIKNMGYINFYYVNDRLDILEGGTRLEEIKIFNLNSDLIKDIKFTQSYRSSSKRLVLDRVDFISNLNNRISYNLNYNRVDDLAIYNSSNVDYYGFNSDNNNQYQDKINPEISQYGLLKEIITPTKEKIHFDYEQNTYSHVGSNLDTLFYNVNNRILKNINLNYSGYDSENNSQYRYFELDNIQSVNFKINVTNFTQNITNSNRNIDKSGWKFILLPVISQEPSLQNGLIFNYVTSYVLDQTRSSIVLNLEEYDLTLQSNFYLFNKDLYKGAYIIKFLKAEFLANNRVDYNFDFNMYEFTNEFKYNYSGGSRIKNISYFNDNDDLLKKISYKYNFFNNYFMSSGSLNSQKPMWYYNKRIDFLIRLTFSGQSSFFRIPWLYDIFTNYNNLKSVLKNGNYVTYKNVEVKEIYNNKNNGYSEYTYTNAIDYPERSYSLINPEVIENYNFNYKRGLLKDLKIYNDKNQIKKNVIYNYSFSDEKLITLGVIPYDKLNCPFFNNFKSFQHYKQNIYNQFLTDCGYVNDVYEFYKYKKAVGWSKLISKDEIEYFVNGNIFKRNQYFYNNINKKLSGTVSFFPNGEKQENLNSYFYNFNINDIGKVKSVSNIFNETNVTETKIEFNNNWTENISFLPNKVSSTKNGSEFVDYEILKYDSFSNILETKDPNKNHVSYIYGYNKRHCLLKCVSSKI